ncbi:MAG: peptidoglycan DD-metalloendopeptidase family protein [Rudaea sp.]|uniref:peptidoglycan DD-metalloendopeptidase family protein n=1 Tax=Rudaea sp. TaxID=2136325 RepID=UPI0039E49DB2
MPTMKAFFDQLRSFGAFALLAAGAIWLAGCVSDPADDEDRSFDESPSLQSPPPQRAKTPPPDSSYRVVKGDTLYSIAFKRGLDYRDVAAWNGIAAPQYKILIGQEIRLGRPGTPSAAMQTHPAAAATNAAGPTQPAAPAFADTPPATVAATPKNTGMFEDVPNEPTPSAATQPEPVAAAASAPAPSSPAAAPPPASAPDVVAPPAKPAAKPAPPAPTSVNESATANVAGIAWRWPSGGKVIGTYVAGDQTRQGVDIAGSAGDPVQAAADGEVVYSGNGLLGYGELIIVKHNAKFLSAYGHNRRRLVAEGDKVRAGQQIAEMGSSSASRDELHFEIRKDGKPVNPLDYLPAR